MPYSPMSPAEVTEFLMTGTRTGKLATVRADGRPHVAPIWFVLKDGHIVFNTHEESVKGRNLAREGRAALSVDDPHPPYSFVMIEGSVSLTADAPDLVAIAGEIGGRYMGAENAEAYGRRNGVPGEYVVRLSMDKVVSAKDLAD
ncbi:MAG: PPOX class F420-dependent oxidoreductase [Acidimicrobiales bacterium]